MKRHETDLTSLASGLIFLGIAAWWVVHRLLLEELRAVWVVAIALMVVGTIGLIAGVRSGMSGDKHRSPDAP